MRTLPQLWVRICGETPLNHVPLAMPLSFSALDSSAPCSLSNTEPSLLFSCPPACYPKHWMLPVEVEPAYMCFLLVLQTPSLPPQTQRFASTGRLSGGVCSLLGWQPRGWETGLAQRGAAPQSWCSLAEKETLLAHLKCPVINSQPYYLLLENHSAYLP